jgi:prevent-host-death family protein
MDIRYPLSEVRNKLSSLVDQVERSRERITIMKHSRDAAVLISPTYLDELEKTIEFFLSNDERSEILKKIRRAEADVSAGNVTALDDVAESFKRREF